LQNGFIAKLGWPSIRSTNYLTLLLDLGLVYYFPGLSLYISEGLYNGYEHSPDQFFVANIILSSSNFLRELLGANEIRALSQFHYGFFDLGQILGLHSFANFVQKFRNHLINKIIQLSNENLMAPSKSFFGLFLI
jgi:hypothetical protein